MSLVEMGLSAGVLIALAAALRLTAGGRLPRRMYIALWDLASLRLLVPLSVPWRFAPRALLGRWLSTPDAPGMAALAAVQAALPETAYAASPRAFALRAERTLTEQALAGQALVEKALAAVWLLGALVLAAYFMRAYAVSLRAFAAALPDGDPRVAAFLSERPLRRRVRVRVSEAIAAPLSYGVLRPVILLPRAMPRDGGALRFVLAHELWHIRAFDPLRKLALVACVCAHWINPFVWIMFFLANRDMELLCDERVLAGMGPAARRDYARTLLDMEERRCRPSPLVSGFSKTAIEERITVMCKMKKTGVASMLLAIVLVLGAGVALATGAPEDESASSVLQEGVPAATVEEGDALLSTQTWEAYYAQYTPYGLSYDGAGSLLYGGKKVRYFEDMYPCGMDGEAGTCVQFDGGEVDVYAIRDLSGPIIRQADGSFDPSGVLIGLREATPEEFDERTRYIREADSGAARIQVSAVDTQTLAEYAFSVDASVTEEGGEPSLEPDIVWWTAEEYAAWMERERVALQEMVDQGAIAYTGSDGWFVWTQARADEAMARYQQTLEDIRRGARVSRPVYGDEGITIYQKPADEADGLLSITYVEQEAAD